jgi:GT2 family glycosyltransferase
MKACKNILAEVLVIDNNSSDGSRAYLEPKFAGVSFFWLNENMGFAKANNMALKQASGKYILFLNPDTLVGEDCFSSCLGYLNSRESPGALGIRMIDGSGNFLKESKRGFPSLTASFFKLAGLAALFPSSRIFSRYYMAHLSQYENNTVDVLAGAFMMVPKIILDKVGSFDERFFMYGEDVDLSYRIKKGGYTNYYYAASTIIHFKGESTQKHDLAYVSTFYRAMKLFVNKHYPKTNALLYGFFFSLLIGIKSLGMFFSTLFSNRKDCLEGPLIRACVGTGHAVLCENSVSTMNELLSLQESKNIREVVFCEGAISFSEIIDAIQKIKPGIVFRFSAAGSGSLVSSNDKNKRGEVLVL